MSDVELGWRGGWLVGFVIVGCALSALFLGGCASEQPKRIPPLEIRCAPSNYEKCAEKCAKEGRGDAAILENRREVECLCRKPPEGA